MKKRRNERNVTGPISRSPCRPPTRRPRRTVAHRHLRGGIYIEDYRDLEQQVEAIAHVDLIEQDLLEQAPRRGGRASVRRPGRERRRDRGPSSARPAGPRGGALPAGQRRRARGRTGRTAGSSSTTRWTSGRRLAIVPSWERYDTDRTVITLDPGMAFGTGTHENDRPVPGSAGRGDRGRRARAGHRHGLGHPGHCGSQAGRAAAAEGVDIDPMCVRTAGENAALNGVDGRLRVLVGDLSEKASGVYDVICANIVANAIKSLAPHVPPLLAKDGVFSGQRHHRHAPRRGDRGPRGAGPARGFRAREKTGWVCLVCALS